MNVNQIINMVLRQVMRRGVNAAINGGINRMSKSKNPDGARSTQDDISGRSNVPNVGDKVDKQRLKEIQKLMRRSGKF